MGGKELTVYPYARGAMANWNLRLLNILFVYRRRNPEPEHLGLIQREQKSESRMCTSTTSHSSKGFKEVPNNMVVPRAYELFERMAYVAVRTEGICVAKNLSIDEYLLDRRWY